MAVRQGLLIDEDRVSLFQSLQIDQVVFAFDDGSRNLYGEHGGD